MEDGENFTGRREFVIIEILDQRPPLRNQTANK